MLLMLICGLYNNQGTAVIMIIKQIRKAGFPAKNVFLSHNKIFWFIIVQVLGD